MAKTGISIEHIKELAGNSTIAELLENYDGAFEQEQHSSLLAACYLACIEGLGLTPFDEQLQAAYEIYAGNIVEMKTGEGKTISAVFAAFLKLKDGQKVHILTYNDYLAKRDMNWMKPITDLLGISTGVILESTGKQERRQAYACDIVYSTAKEVGFDFLRDFISDTAEDMILPPLQFVIVDEADSILIDEARIPLVIAGDVEYVLDERLPQICEFVGQLDKSCFGVSLEDENAFLTDAGANECEEHFGVDNIYAQENMALLSLINDCLNAHYVLKENQDYVVRDGSIKIIDSFTGRLSENRHYPGTLQAAVEAKHGIRNTFYGREIGIIPIQFFMRQYQQMSGMTGTAATASEEFELLYGLQTVVIPPHVPSRREDHEPCIYFNSELKWQAVVDEVVKRHSKNQPILVGTTGIEQSQMLADKLTQLGITGVNVLNAKNSEKESEILKDAGKLGAITISTNMSGRGVDIVLGGRDAAERDQVIEAGGLCAIDTCMHESSRITKQLMGRAGRQGDIGESMTFFSMDEEIMERYNLRKLIGDRRYNTYTAQRITDKSIIREVERIQRISEGDTLDRRKQLLKFTMIGEKHRDAVFQVRTQYLRGEAEPTFWQEDEPELFKAASDKFDENEVKRLERECAVAAINEVWSSYLEYTDDLRRGIHLTKVGGKNPSQEYNIQCEEYYTEMKNELSELVMDYLYELSEANSIKDVKIRKPSKIWTYLSNDTVDDLEKRPFLVNALTEHIIDGSDEEEAAKEAAEIEAESKKGFFAKLLKKGFK